MTAGAADPNTGTVSLDATNTGWNGKEYGTGMSMLPEANTTRVACAVPTDDLCDHFDLTADIDASHWESNRGGVEMMIAWADETDHFDLYVFDADGNEVGSSATAGGTSERVFIENASGEYQVRVVPWDVTPPTPAARASRAGPRSAATCRRSRSSPSAAGTAPPVRSPAAGSTWRASCRWRRSAAGS